MADGQARGLALRVRASALNQRALQLVGRRLPRLTRGWMPWLALRDYPVPELRGPDWVRLRPQMAGICGSDLALLTGRASPILSPFASFPAILGHEVVAIVEEAGSAAGFGVGDRVVVDPVISCFVRGLDPCPACGEGLPALCLHAADGDLSPGMLIGYCHDLPGGWSTSMLAHASQLHRVPDAISDQAAVLAEPLACGLHAVLAAPPNPDRPVLVVGGGTIGLGVVMALRHVQPDADITAVVRHPIQARLAERLGATRVVVDRRGDGPQHAAVEVTGANRHRPIVGASVYTGGFDLVYDCVGSAASLDASLRATAARGRLVLLGTAGELQRLDLTLAWARELRIIGSYVYGREASLPGAPHTIDHLLSWLAQADAPPVAELVTHRFELERWREALATAWGRSRHASVKVAFEQRDAYAGRS
ncbi:MAG TPA: alcohol dehydrogenase catalytic domain-containing protein [Candidatus Saccharimonadales bacterium]|nr:alcohol dehydrogenase catalytic domain-containing protein [Candidatus Saccharimonadales bacterium]